MSSLSHRGQFTSIVQQTHRAYYGVIFYVLSLACDCVLHRYYPLLFEPEERKFSGVA